MLVEETESRTKPERRGRQVVRWLAGAILVLAAGLGAFYGESTAPTRPSQEMAKQPVVRDFVRVLDLIDEQYVVTPDRERLTRGAIVGMLHALDPHSNFFDRREFSEMQDEQSSHFYGIGVTINQRNGRIYVLGVSEGRPAEKAGLRYGDALLAVDEHSAKDWTQSDALQYVRGERGTTVKITVERVGEPAPLTVEIMRDEVPYPSVRNAFMLRPEIGYVGLTGGFNQETSDELHNAISELKEQGMKELILDLRRNPGGLLKQAIQVSETFLPRGTEIVSVRGREGRYPSQVYRSETTNPETLPLVILINGETASASEIVAGAMQDRSRAWIVGEESFGKGLVQTVFRLRGGTGLTLTTAKYYTPSGRSIQRPYNGLSFYDYFSTRRVDEESGKNSGATKPAAKSSGERGNDKFYTSTGNEVYGGGGIRPDTVVKITDEHIPLRDACFEFARLLVSGTGQNLPEYKIKQTEHGHRLRGNEFPVTESVIQAFREFVRLRPQLQVRETEISNRLDYVRRRIRAELLTAAYGLEIAEQFLIESDPQAMRALEELPKAKRLSDQARLFPTHTAATD